MNDPIETGTPLRPAPATARVRAVRGDEGVEYPLSPEQYIAARLDDQIRWYSRKSATNQARYKGLQTAAILFSSAIPLIVGLWGDVLAGRIVVGVLSFLVAAIMGINSLNKFHENWIAYRTTAESLRHHKLLYLTQTEPYVDADAFHRLVETTEALISRENSDWGRLMKSVPGQGAAGATAQQAAS